MRDMGLKKLLSTVAVFAAFLLSDGAVILFYITFLPLFFFVSSLSEGQIFLNTASRGLFGIAMLNVSTSGSLTMEILESMILAFS